MLSFQHKQSQGPLQNTFMICNATQKATPTFLVEAVWLQRKPISFWYLQE
jgi:hypothetical protein